MGNIGSSGSNNRRRHGGGGTGRRVHPPETPPPMIPPFPEANSNRFVYNAATTPYPNYPNYYPPPPTTVRAPLPAPYDHHHRPAMDPMWSRYPPPPPAPYVEHQKAVTIKNDVNIKKETLRIEPDGEDSGKFLVSFTFDATVSGR